MLKISRNSVFAVGVFFIVILAAYDAIQQASTSLPTADGLQYTTSASNIVRKGVFSASTENPEPDYRRDVGYSFFLAVAGWPIFANTTTECIIEDDACGPSRLKLGYINAAVSVTVAVVAGVGAYFITGSMVAGWCAVALVGLVRWFRIEIPSPEALAALLFAGHSLALYALVRMPNKTLWAFAGGAFLAALVLTKAIFIYWFYLILASGLFLVWTKWRREWLCFIVVPLIVCGGWMARNSYHFDDFSISGRDGEVLIIRAAFLDMTTPEMLAGFAYYAPVEPTWFRQSLLSLVSRENLWRHGRRNDDGFYRVGKAATRVGADQASRDEQLKASAIDRIKESPIRYLTQSVMFAWQAAFPVIDSAAERRPHQQVHEVAVYVRLIGFAVMLGLFVWSLARRRFDVTAFLLPAMFCWGIHAVATHAIPRYSQPIVPVMIISVTMALVLITSRIAKPNNRAVSRNESDADEEVVV